MEKLCTNGNDSVSLFLSFRCDRHDLFLQGVDSKRFLAVRELPQYKHTWFSCVGGCLHSLQFPVAP